MKCYECGVDGKTVSFVRADSTVEVCFMCSVPSYSLISDYTGDDDLDEIDRRLVHTNYIQSLDGSMLLHVKNNVSNTPKYEWPYK